VESRGRNAQRLDTPAEAPCASTSVHSTRRAERRPAPRAFLTRPSNKSPGGALETGLQDVRTLSERAISSNVIRRVRRDESRI
jgi:hypothetical protein